MNLNLGVIAGCFGETVRRRHNVGVLAGVMWGAGEGVYGEVSEKRCGMVVECLRGEVVEEIDAFSLVPDGNDKKFRKVKVR